MKKAKKGISFLLAVTIVISALMGTTFTTVSAVAFSDTVGHWAEDEINTWSTRGALNGYEDGTFRPDNNISRAELTKIVVSVKNVTEISDVTFSDVPATEWYSSYIARGVAAGYVNGYEDGSFMPDNAITRQETAAIFARAYSLAGAGNVSSFADASQIESWAVDYVGALVEAGAVNGYEDGTFRPHDYVTRAEVVKILDRLENMNTDTSDDSLINNIVGGIFGGNGGGSNDGFGGGGSTGGSTAVAKCTVTFDSNGGTSIASQQVISGKTITEPEDPEKDGYTFMGWLDSNDEYFDFDENITENITLTADWIENVEITDEELAQFMNPYSGNVTTEIDDDKIIGVDVEYQLDGMGGVGAYVIDSDPMISTAGLIGKPVQINAAGSDVINATITFHYNDNNLGNVNPEDLAIVWYDENNNITTLLEGSVVDTAAKTVSVTTTHFSKYGVVVRSIWDELWNTPLPAVRTDTTPYYDIILAVDCSGSMNSDGKMTRSIEAAKGLIDVLADDDSVSIYAFANTTSCIVNKTKMVSVLDDGDTQDNRYDIKKQIEALNASGGTNIEDVLQNAYNNKIKDPKYQSLVILLSDGQSSVSDQVLENLQDNEQKVIAVGVGSDVNDELMEKIATKTGGSYIYCENSNDLADAFIDLQNTYIGSTKDTDGDGLPDVAEIAGMRDQYGNIIRTDPNNRDSDGDGYSDGEEMGDYIALSKQTYFERISDPELYTVRSDESNIFVPDCMDFCFEENENKLNLIIYIKNFNYRMVPDEITPIESDGIPKEYIYADPINLKAELLDVEQYGFTLDDAIDITENKNNNGDVEGYTVTATLSYKQDTELKSVTWRITADNCSEWSGYKETGIKANYVHKPQSTVSNVSTNNKLDSAQLNMANQAKQLIEALYNKAEDKSSSEEIINARNAIKQQMNVQVNDKEDNVPDEVYDAFALAILESLEGSEIDEYETNQNKLANQIYNQIKGGLGSDTKTVNVGECSYTVQYTVLANNGIGVGWQYVSWTDGSRKQATLTWTNVGTREGNEALADYCAALAQLNNDLWQEFMAYYISDGFGVLNIQSVTNSNVLDVLNKTEKVIKALCDKDDANALIEEMGDTVKNELKSGLTNNFKKYVKENIPYGNDIISAAEKYKKVKEKYDKLQKLWNEDRTSTKTEKAYINFQTAYNALEEAVNNLK